MGMAGGGGGGGVITIRGFQVLFKRCERGKQFCGGGGDVAISVLTAVIDSLRDEMRSKIVGRDGCF